MCHNNQESARLNVCPGVDEVYCGATHNNLLIFKKDSHSIYAVG